MKNDSKTSKHQQVKNYLLKRGSITSWEAIEKFCATRLSAIIFNLKKEKHLIETKRITFTDKFGVKNSFAKYILKKK